MAALHTETKRVAGNLFLRDTNLSPANSLWETCPLQAIASDPSLASVYYNDFRQFTTGEEGLQSDVTDGGSVAVVAASAAYPNGVVKLLNDGATDNEEVYLGSETATWILRTGKDLWYESRIMLVEANTDKVNVMTGLTSTMADDTIQDGVAGPKASYDGIVFWKVDSGTEWNVESSQAGNQTTNLGVQARVSATWVNVGFHVNSNSTIDFYLDGVQVSSIAANLPTAAMGLFWGVKNGSTTPEAFYADFVKVVQLR